MTLFSYLVCGIVALGGVLILAAAAGNVVVKQDAASNRVLISQIRPADAALLTSLKDYYGDKSRCPQVHYEQRALNKWPRLPAIMAGIKFALTQDQGWKTDNKTRDARRRMLQVLEDPNFKIEYSEKTNGLSEQELLDRTGHGEDFASGQPIDGSTIRLGPTSDFNRYNDQKDPNDRSKVLVKREDTGLAISVLHELYHLTQLRSDPTLTNLHGNPKTERPAYAFSGSEPPLALLRAGDPFYQAAAAATCPQLRAALPSGSQSGGVGQSLVLVIDASGSMAGQKLTDAKRAASDMLTNQIQPGNEVALVVYTDCKQISWEPFTTQPKSLIPKVEAIRASGSTDMSGAIRVAEAHLTGGDAKGATGAVVLLSDGDDNCGGNPVDATRSLVSKKVPTARLPAPRAGTHAFSGAAADVATKGEIHLHTVGFQVSGAAERQLRDMSLAGNGVYYPATNYSDLSQALSSAVLADLGPEHEPVPATPLALEERALNVTGGLLPVGLGASMAAGAAIYFIAASKRRGALQSMSAAGPEAWTAATTGFCQACGAQHSGTRFCFSCGAALAPPVSVQPAPPLCSRCNTPSTAGDRFCVTCGLPLSGEAA